MKLKHIAAAIAFSAAFFFSTLLIGFPKAIYNLPHQCNLQARPTVTSLLEQDINFGLRRDEQAGHLYQIVGSADSTYTSEEYAEIITEYVRKSENLDDSTLPQDFRSAWQNHMKVWREHANFLSIAKKSFFKKNMSQSEFFEVFREQDQEITDTWRKVEVYGRKYGANVRY